MPDLNKLITDIENTSKELKIKLGDLLKKYEDLYREGNRQFRTERSASAGSLEGLEEFHRLVLIVKRNKDVIGSLTRGITGLRTISTFKFVEEEVPVPKPKKAKKSISKEMIVSEPIVVEDN